MSEFKLKKPEILAPAGSLEVLKTAVLYGADAVYIGGDVYGLRARAKNFSEAEMAEGIRFAHDHGAKVYVTANIIAHNDDFEGMAEYFKKLSEIKPDAILVADPGVFTLAREKCPDMDIHISTQANNVNYRTFNFWHDLGAVRVVTGRELSLEEIKEIRKHIPEDLEIETFVHGAMCISYSGRCLLSNYFTGRDANKGECTHPCRWKYYVMEEKRPGEYLPVYENERGTYIFNSRDLCMIDHIPDLVNAGISSFKIEGRMKTALYVAGVTRAYRNALDDFFESPSKYEEKKQSYIDEVSKCTYRQFTTGFFYGKPDHESQVYDSNTYITNYRFLGIIKEREGNISWFLQKNKFAVGDTLEVMKPDGTNISARVTEMYDEDKTPVNDCPHPSCMVGIRLESTSDGKEVVTSDYDILRQKV